MNRNHFKASQQSEIEREAVCKLDSNKNISINVNQSYHLQPLETVRPDCIFLSWLSYCCLLSFSLQARHSSSQTSLLLPLEEHPGGHFIMFCPLEGQNRRNLIMVYLLQRFPIEQFCSIFSRWFCCKTLNKKTDINQKLLLKYCMPVRSTGLQKYHTQSQFALLSSFTSDLINCWS